MPDPLGQLEMEMEDEERAKTSKKEPKTKKVPVVEVFGPTIQGEGVMIGVRTSFIRFGLCDYKCVMCDSMHAVDPIRVKANATWLLPDEILARVEVIHRLPSAGGATADWVTYSGGNPCIHDLTVLTKYIQAWGLKIAVETQGTFLPDWLHMCDVVTVSPKAPGIGEQYEHDKFLAFVDAFLHHPGFNVKVVVFSMRDIEWSRTINSVMKDHGLGDKMYLSLGNPFPPGKDHVPDNPKEQVHPSMLKLALLEEYRQLTEDLLQVPDMRNVKFLPQLHVLTWGNKQGV